jgi:two-component system OmpR family response regulator
MEPTTHILLVEDDCEISSLVSRFLRSNDFRVSTAGDGREMTCALKDSRIDLVVLDLMLPGENGLSLCRKLKASTDLPIIMLTAKTEEIDRIVGLELGADDYLGKPFSVRELMARIRAVLRRGSSPAGGADERLRTPLRFVGWTLDPAVRTLSNPEGARVSLTGAEFELLFVFCQRPHRALSRDQLLDLTQSRAAAPYERSIDILVSRLRQKIERDPRDPMLIQTIRSSGYLFAPEVVAA